MKTRVRLVDTNDVEDLRCEIIRAFPVYLSVTSEVVVKVLKEPFLPVGADPKSLDPAMFQDLDPEDTLAAALKPDIVGKYRVYVELLTAQASGTAQVSVAGLS